MKRRLHDWSWPAVAFVAAIAFPGVAAAQHRYRLIEEPKWLKMRVTEVSAGVYAEGRFEETTYRDSDTSVTHDRLFVGPSVGLQLDGSVYHPNLLRYSILSDGAIGWAEDNVRTESTKRDRSEWEYLGRFHGSADILANKPFNANLFGDYDHTYRDYDFFNRVTVDSWRYGGQMNYSIQPFSFNAHYTHLEEDSSGLSGLTRSEDDVMGLVARHDRESGATVLSYTYNEYTREDFGTSGEGNDHNVTLSNAETFGSRDQYRLNSSVTYLKRDSFDEPTDELIANGNLLAEHSDILSSFYDFNYDGFSSDNFESDNYSGRAEVRHQLYESLASTVFVQGSDYEASDEFSSGYIRRFGGGFSESYSKRLGPEHHLRINNSVLLEHVDQEGISTVRNERHTFGEAGGPNSFILRLPKVMEATIVVTDVNDSQPPFIAGLDYLVLRNGDLTIIERSLGSRIPNVVLVDYEAEPPQAGSYEALNELFHIRLDFWKGLWGIYTRVNLYLNNADKDLAVQDLRSYTFGSDVTWRWFRAGAEYEIYDSDQSRYNSARLFQSFSFRPDSASSLGIEFSESWTDYEDADRQEENYRLVTRYHRTMTRRLRTNLEGGVAVRRGRGVDQTLATVRPAIDYVIGKTTVKAGYEFEYQSFLDNEERYKHMFFVRAVRVF